MRVFTTALLLAGAALLAGCSSMRIVDSDVTSFVAAGAPAVTVPATYRFERLPSQQADAQRQQALETLITPALGQAGLQRNDSAPQYTLQVEVRVFRDPQAPWDDPRYIRGYIRPAPFATPYGYWMHYPSMAWWQADFPYYRRELHLVLRRVSDGQVAFESRAQHDGRWSDDVAVLPAMVQAALQGFPAAQPGPRRVVVEIPR